MVSEERSTEMKSKAERVRRENDSRGRERENKKGNEENFKREREKQIKCSLSWMRRNENAAQPEKARIISNFISMSRISSHSFLLARNPLINLLPFKKHSDSRIKQILQGPVNVFNLSSSLLIGDQLLIFPLQYV